MKPTYEELESRCRELEERNAKLEDRCEKLEALLTKALDRIATLEEQLNQNSANSSKPPSSDFKRNSRGIKSKRRPKRDGFARALLPLDQVDKFETCSIDSCPNCGSSQLQSVGDPLILQQVELPQVKGIVTQYERQLHRCTCCHEKTVAPLPNGIPNSAFGPRLMALLANLTGVLHLSKDDARQLVLDLYGVSISDGSVANVEERVSVALQPINERIHNFVTQSQFCKHFDETSWRDSGLTHYVWVASTKQAACYRIHRHRSMEAFKAIAGRLNSSAPIVTDRYAVYNSTENPHQYCIPHLIRNFRRFAQRDGPDGEIGSKIEKELQYLSHTHGQFRLGKVSLASYKQRLRHCRKRIDDLFMDALVGGTGEDFATLCQKLLLDDFEKLWTFLKFSDAEPSNNLAERDLRRIVLWRKKSYGTRSFRGQRYAETISSVAATCRRQGRRIFDFLVEAVASFYRADTAPMIQPSLGF